MPLFLTATATVLILATLMPLSVRREWWIRALDFPRLQIAILALLWLIGWYFAVQNSGIWLSTLAVCVSCVLIYQCTWILPHTELHTQEVSLYSPDQHGEAPTIKIMSSNVLMTNRNSAPLLELIYKHQPDIVITLESDQWWQDQLDTIEHYPHRLACPLDNLYGMHVFSRLPLHDSATEFLVESDKPSMRTRIDVSHGVSVHLHVVHPAPPAPGENDESTERDVELIMLAKALAGSQDRIIVAGDLNDVAWSATTRLFRQVSGLLDPRIGRGLYNTFNAFHWYARWPLDHVFVSSHFQVVKIQRLPKIGSDHYPLLFELAVTDGLIVVNSVEEEDKDEERLDSIVNSTAAHTADDPSVPLPAH